LHLPEYKMTPFHSHQFSGTHLNRTYVTVWWPHHFTDD